jgi:peroxiredoxin
MHTRTPSARLPLAAALLALGASPALADPPGGTLMDQVIQAYQDAPAYSSTSDFEMRRESGRWTMTQQAEFHTAWDGQANRLRVDTPDMYLLAADGRLQLRGTDLPGVYLDTASADPPSYTGITQAVPMIGQPLQADVVLLTAEDPVAALSGQMTDAPDRLEPDAAGRPGLQMNTPDGVLTLRIDPDTHLITESQLEVAPQSLPGGGEETITVRQTFEPSTDALSADAFAFDTDGRQAAGSLQEMLTLAANAQAGPAGAGPAAGGGGHVLQNQPAPPITLQTLDGETFELEDVEQQVVVLDFWASWCPPCVRGLPVLQEVADWADENDKDVLVATINVREDEPTAQQFWERHGLSMPVLMDTTGQVAQAYGVQGIPQTVVINNGQVANVHVGFSPQLGDQLRTEIDTALDNPGDE